LPPQATPRIVKDALEALDGQPVRVHLRDWPGRLQGLDHAGLYSYWVDEEGRKQLSAGLGVALPRGRIYVGQSGGTQWPSGKRGKSTLQQRIGRQHRSGNIGGSTFRTTLAAALSIPLGLKGTKDKLTPPGEQRLTEWIRTHLEAAVFPVDDRDILGDLERKVLQKLDPPLNLNEMSPSAIRTRVSELRRQLTA